MTTINSYSVGFGLDASAFVDGSKISRAEARALQRDIEAVRTPAEKMAVEQTRLANALNSGAISQGTYNRLLKEKRTALMGTTSVLGPYSAAITVVAGGVVAATAAGVGFVQMLRSQQAEIDATAKAAAKLGLSFSEISSLRFAASEIGGLDDATTDKSIQKMQIAIAKAVDGDQTTREAFGKLGLDAGLMLQQGAVESLLDISDAFAGLGSQAERLNVATDIFGKGGAELVSTLQAGRDVIAESVGFQQKWGELTDQQSAMVEANNDAWGRVFYIAEGITNKLAAEFAPAMQLVADYILDGSEGFADIDGAVKLVVDNTVYFAGVMYDVYEVAEALHKTLYQVATLDFSGAREGIADALDFGSGQAALDALNKKREEFANAAAEKERQREEERARAVFESEDAIAAKQQDALDSHIEAHEKFIADQERKQEQMARSAIAAAEKEFEAKRKAQQKIRDDVSAGPGAGMESGSAEAAKFMAQQVNAAIGAAVAPDAPTPTEAQMLEESKKQYEKLVEADTKLGEQTEVLKQMLEEAKNNGFKRIR